MGKINGCLKCVFIFFNVLYAILGCLLIFAAVKASAFSNEMAALGSPSVVWFWLFAIGVLAISCLGIYAGGSEKASFLKIFAAFMVAGMIIMLCFGIYFAVTRNKMKYLFESASKQAAEPYMENDGLKAMLEGLQATAQCCGIVGPTDWGDDIPNSCDCKQEYGVSTFGYAGCRARPQGTTGPDQIYDKSCSETLFSWIDLAFQIGMGFCFGLAVTALLGLLISLLMIHQVDRRDSVGGPSIAMKGY